MKKHFLILSFSLLALAGFGQEKFQVKSPDGKMVATVQVGRDITYSISHESQPIIQPSAISIQIENAPGFGIDSKVRNSQTRSVNEVIPSPFYKRSQITDQYNELTIRFKENFNLIFRAYNEGIAYRFVSTGKKDFIVSQEEVNFIFNKDFNAYVPYVRTKSEDLEKQYINSFENLYTYTQLSQLNPKKLMFSPVVVEVDNGKKVCIAESDLESYPGMFLINSDQSTSLKGLFAPHPKTVAQGGYNNLQEIVLERESYIARCEAKTNFPWRIVIVSTEDKELADNDMVYKLAAPSKVADTSWIKPGKVAWEWWNCWGISRVDFETGVNNETYMAYIDFASRNQIEYVILDEGWAINLQANLFQVVPEIDLNMLVAYAESKNVGIILWAGYYAFARDMEKVCQHYSAMGIKGFKVDFMDRDDQPMVDFHYKAAGIAAKYNMLLDFHGTYKPTGLNRTYPNVINFEGVHGQEQTKWNDITFDQVTYDVTMPFIRMVAGPVDYTQGAMRNGSKKAFRPITTEPMSMGTRCRQLAEYVIFESPLNMLCDSPTLYEKEQECTDFIATIPTVWDNTIALDGAIGKHIAIARQSGQDWYVGALTGWEGKEMELDLSFLPDGNYAAELFKDGINAHKTGSDYKKEHILIPDNRKLKVYLAPGGGCALKIYRK